jgi:hypothetical protein
VSRPRVHPKLNCGCPPRVTLLAPCCVRAPHYFEVDAMTRRDLLRRVVLVCCSFGRNLAYYRVGQEGAFSPLLGRSHPHASFWLQANSSFLYVTALEWCKLIGDISLCHVNVAIDLPGLPQIPAPVTNQSCAATSSANTFIGVGCPHAPPSCANLHSARRSRRHRLPFPAGSFIEGFRTPATVQAASLRSAGIRNPQHNWPFA